MGKTLMLFGVAIVLIGLLLHVAPGLFAWFGKLPGDIRYESGRTRVFIPITSMLLISIVGSLVLHLLRR